MRPWRILSFPRGAASDLGCQQTRQTASRLIARSR